MSYKPPAYLVPALTALRRGDAPGARRAAEAALAGRPGDALVEHLLGVACCQLGDLASGITHLERALAAQPGDTRIKLLLARALIDALDHDRAFELTEHCREPEMIEIRARSASLLGRHEAQATALGELVAVRPGDSELCRSHGHALALMGDMDAAAEALDRALRLDPGSIETRVELGQLLCDMGQAESGLAAFEDGIRIDPKRPELMLGKARALTMLRRFEEAERAYFQVLKASPTSAEATREYGLLLERTGRIGELPSLLARAREAGISEDDLGLLAAHVALRDKDYQLAIGLAEATIEVDPVRVYRLIAKIEDARGNVSAAFEAAQLMNNSVPDRDHWRRRGADARAEIRRLAGATTADWAGRFPPAAAGERAAPAFIVGFPRSGTTLLDTFLMGHRDVVVFEEEPMLEAAKAVVGDLALLPDASDATIRAARDAYFTVLDKQMGGRDDCLVVDKMPFNMLGAGLIYRLFPDARVIFVQRHPCDVVLSGFMQSFRLNDGMASFLDLGDAADLYGAAMDLWTRSRAVVPLRVYDLIYEDLIENQPAALRALIAFLGLEWREELLDHQRTAAMRGTIITPSYDQVTQPINRAAIGRWRGLTSQMEAALPILMPWARRLGYDD